MAEKITRIHGRVRFIHRRDTAEKWKTANPVLAAGEHGVVTDSATPHEREKIGDGVTPWNDLGWWHGPKGEQGEKGKDAVTDQTYNPQSENAQSGWAVYQAIEQNIDLGYEPESYKAQSGFAVREAFMKNTDIEYNPNSENAQSGKAVAEAVLDKPKILVGTSLSLDNPNVIGHEQIYGDLGRLKVGDIYINQNEYAAYIVLYIAGDYITYKRISGFYTDLEYNPDSENAQSGKAVAEAVRYKADVKITSVAEGKITGVTTSSNKAYVDKNTPYKVQSVTQTSDTNEYEILVFNENESATIYFDYENGILPKENDNVFILKRSITEVSTITAFENIDVMLENKQDKFATVTHEEQEFAGKITYVTLEGTFYFGNFAYVSETGSLVLTGGCSVADCKICDLKTPTEDTDAANKVYVDTAIGSIETALDAIIAIQEQLIGGAV